MSHDGFTDLRLNSGTHSEVQEGFWPSFTDIMTVIVMIFLISMVVLLIRNIELVNQLRATVEAERVAAELARATGEEKDSLSSALHRAEERLQTMQLEVLRLQDKTIRHETLIADQLRAISGLTDERDDLGRQAAQLTLLRERLEEDVAQRQLALDQAMQDLDRRQLMLNSSQRRVATLESELSAVEREHEQAQIETEQLQRRIADQRASLDEAERQTEEVERRYLGLTDDFDELKNKYDKLVRPARSRAGRYLIEVRYWKSDGEPRIAWREGGSGPFQDISRKHLDLVLQRLAEEMDNGLYVKVIFPENSGLSYNEAWEFTSHLHANYDYYFRGDASAPAAADPPSP